VRAPGNQKDNNGIDAHPSKVDPLQVGHELAYLFAMVTAMAKFTRRGYSVALSTQK
jgi:hypothetical protein